MTKTPTLLSIMMAWGFCSIGAIAILLVTRSIWGFPLFAGLAIIYGSFFPFPFGEVAALDLNLENKERLESV